MKYTVGSYGHTDYRVQLVDGSGKPLTGKTAGDFPPVYYSVNNSTVQITLVDLSNGDGYHSGGILEDAGDAGWYRLDLPNEAFTAEGTVLVWGEASGKSVLGLPIAVMDNSRVMSRSVSKSDLFIVALASSGWTTNGSFDVVSSGRLTGSGTAYNDAIIQDMDFSQPWEMQFDVHVGTRVSSMEVSLTLQNSQGDDTASVVFRAGTNNAPGGKCVVVVNGVSGQQDVGAYVYVDNTDYTFFVTFDGANLSADVRLGGVSVGSAFLDVSVGSPTSDRAVLGMGGVTGTSQMYISAARFAFKALGSRGTFAIQDEVASGVGGGGGDEDGEFAINHNSGGADALRYVRSGKGIPAATIRIYVAEDFDAGLRNPVGESVTGSDGRWTRDVMLDPGDYYVTFDAARFRLQQVAFTVGEDGTVTLGS